MKLRNKKTGEIGYFCFANWNDPVLLIMDKDGVQLAKYNSLTELNEEWEDAPEETKEYWYVSCDGRVLKATTDEDEYNEKHISVHKSIGNYFENKEEAEKAVEKFKAWQRLKDKGFRFDRWENDKEKYLGDFVIFAHIKDLTDIVDDLDLLFGGEE